MQYKNYNSKQLSIVIHVQVQLSSALFGGNCSFVHDLFNSYSSRVHHHDSIGARERVGLKVCPGHIVAADSW